VACFSDAVVAAGKLHPQLGCCRAEAEKAQVDRHRLAPLVLGHFAGRDPSDHRLRKAVDAFPRPIADAAPRLPPKSSPACHEPSSTVRKPHLSRTKQSAAERDRLQPENIAGGALGARIEEDAGAAASCFIDLAGVGKAPK
jgi:hypothetical protein